MEVRDAPVAQQDRASAFKREPLCGSERIEWMWLYARKSYLFPRKRRITCRKLLYQRAEARFKERR